MKPDFRAYFAIASVSLGSLAGCQSGADTYAPDYSLAPPAHRADQPCGSADPNELCIALKYVAFEDSSGVPVVSHQQARDNVTAVNALWSQCQIQFHVENYAPLNPSAQGLPFSASTDSDLEAIRGALAESSTLLVVTTGQWSGSLGSQPANAWSILPPTGPFGTVLEESVATYPNLIAHELGHDLNLQHVSDRSEVMNPVVYMASQKLTPAECSEARATAISFWGATLR